MVNIVTFTELTKLQKEINKNIKTSEPLGTGLLGEQMILASYKTMPTNKLESLRFIINHIIKQRKEQAKMNDRSKTDPND